MLKFLVVFQALFMVVIFGGTAIAADCHLIPAKKLLDTVPLKPKNPSFLKRDAYLSGASVCRLDNGKFGRDDYRIVIVAKRPMPKTVEDPFGKFRAIELEGVLVPKYKWATMFEVNKSNHRTWFTKFGALGGAKVVLAVADENNVQTVVAVRYDRKQVRELKGKLLKLIRML